jgi:hypothetical protein
MEKRHVISFKNLPIKFPFNSTILSIFLLYYFKVNEFIFGVYIALCLMYWVIVIITKFNEKPIDIKKYLNDDNSN